MNRSRLTRPALSVAISAAVLAGAPPVAAVVDRASIAVETRYLLKADLSFATGTISATERIVVTNRSGGTISKLNLSVMPRAFGELTSISRFTVDGAAVSGKHPNVCAGPVGTR